MTQPVNFAEIWRGDFLESVHQGHAVVCSPSGEIVSAWGDPESVVLPRSSCKMIQALPLIESGAYRAFGLRSEHLALACASHNGAFIHTDPVRAWLEALGLEDDDLRCGADDPKDRAALHDLIKRDVSPCQVHNNCSGKHAGFLTLGQHLGAGPEYVEIDHPVQLAVREAFERLTGGASPGFGIDGCSAPNFATRLSAMAHAMSRFAVAPHDTPEGLLAEAMVLHPELVAGEDRACTRLMRACEGRVAVKTGAEAFYTAILPDQQLGVALKVVDGATRAAECAMAAILVRLGALDAAHPVAQDYINQAQINCRGFKAARMQAVSELLTA